MTPPILPFTAVRDCEGARPHRLPLVYHREAPAWPGKGCVGWAGRGGAGSRRCEPPCECGVAQPFACHRIQVGHWHGLTLPAEAAEGISCAAPLKAAKR